MISCDWGGRFDRLRLPVNRLRRNVPQLCTAGLILLVAATLTQTGCKPKTDAHDVQPPADLPAASGHVPLPKETDPALEAMRQNFEKNPNAYVAVVLAQQYAAAGKKDLAAQVLKAALSLPDVDATSALKVAAGFEALSDAEGRNLALRKAAAIAPGNAEVQTQLQRAGLTVAKPTPAGGDKLAAARKAFEQSGAANEGFALFKALQSAGLTNECERLLLKLKSTPFRTAYDYKTVGLLFSVIGRASEAEELVRKALSLDTNCVDAYYGLASIAFDQANQRHRSATGTTATAGLSSPLAESEASHISELLQAGFAAGLTKRATNDAELDLIGMAIRRSSPIFAAMRQRKEFEDALTEKWAPLREQQEEARDPAYHKMVKACQLLARGPSEDDEAGELARKRVAEHYHLPYTNSAPPTIMQAATLLEEALSLNREEAKTNPGVECLLVTAFLQPRIIAATNRAPVHRVLLNALATTPVPRAWCEDFSLPDSSLLEWDSLDALGSQIKGGNADPLTRAAPLTLPTSEIPSLTLVRRDNAQPSSPPSAPAQVDRLGPHTAESALNALGVIVAETAVGMQADAAFTREIDRLIKTLFAKGYSATLFELNGGESLDQEAAKDLADHVSRHILTRIVRQQSGFFLITETAVGQFNLVQFKGPLRISANRDQVSEIDAANGLRWSGGMQIMFSSAGRVYSRGKWEEWKQMSGVLETYGIKNRNGAWTITWGGSSRFYRPSFRQIKDAFPGQ